MCLLPAIHLIDFPQGESTDAPKPPLTRKDVSPYEVEGLKAIFILLLILEEHCKHIHIAAPTSSSEVAARGYSVHILPHEALVEDLHHLPLVIEKVGATHLSAMDEATAS
jgi:hypothetical protein